MTCKLALGSNDVGTGKNAECHRHDILHAIPVFFSTVLSGGWVRLRLWKHILVCVGRG